MEISKNRIRDTEFIGVCAKGRKNSAVIHPEIRLLERIPLGAPFPAVPPADFIPSLGSCN